MLGLIKKDLLMIKGNLRQAILFLSGIFDIGFPRK